MQWTVVTDACWEIKINAKPAQTNFNLHKRALAFLFATFLIVHYAKHLILKLVLLVTVLNFTLLMEKVNANQIVTLIIVIYVNINNLKFVKLAKMVSKKLLSINAFQIAKFLFVLFV